MAYAAAQLAPGLIAIIEVCEAVRAHPFGAYERSTFDQLVGDRHLVFQSWSLEGPVDARAGEEICPHGCRPRHAP